MDQIDSSTNTRQRELDLSKEEGFEVFTESVVRLAEEVLQYEAVAAVDYYRRLGGGEMFTTFCEKADLLVAELENGRLQTVAGEEISDNQVLLLQQQYNELVQMRNDIRAAYSGFDFKEIAQPEDMTQSADVKKLAVVSTASVEENSKQTEVQPVQPAQSPTASLVIDTSRLQKTINKPDECNNLDLRHARPERKNVPPAVQKKTPAPRTFSPSIFPKQKVVNHLEKKDPINQIVFPGLSHIHSPRADLAETSLTKLYLNQPSDQAFIKKKFSSLAAFERMLDITITRFEASQIDPIENWLGVEYASPFQFLKELSLIEIEELSAHKQLRELLQTENIKYEAYVMWVDKIPQMLEWVEATPNISFGALFARWILANEMNADAPDNSQFMQKNSRLSI